MGSRDLNYFRSLLEKLKQTLLKDNEASKASTRPVALDQTTVGRLSRIDAMQGQAMALAAQRRRDIQLQRIAAAVKRIEDKTYGYCVGCADRIDERRLNVDPTVTLCIPCATQD